MPKLFYRTKIRGEVRELHAISGTQTNIDLLFPNGQAITVPRTAAQPIIVLYPLTGTVGFYWCPAVSSVFTVQDCLYRLEPLNDGYKICDVFKLDQVIIQVMNKIDNYDEIA